MPERFHISYVYINPETAERIRQVIDLTGDSEKGLIGQIVRGFFKREQQYYVAALRQDAAARGLDQQAYAAILVAGEEKNLPSYQGERPIFSPSPIAHIPDVEGETKGVNYLFLNKRNRCLLKVARIVDGGSMTQLVSRIIIDHFRVHWEKTYLPQLVFEENLLFE